ncbi:hypothetical protein HS088_TW10G00127 [Tripterygium wilfordii]|uniref:Uncharacterized protein n=1 Tax=Tripterygium wilfordii TaxID=458696 RepID=A0A7J7D466_TRIWF|nr:hypothetical protein HS088_TW10G00127 [Tripterygium wilfordii]
MNIMQLQVADALSFLTFLKSWAETARGESDIVRPQFISATLFPPKNISGFEPSTGITNQNIVAKRFVFDVSAIETLRTKYTDHVNSTSVPPSRVEALTNFIWNRFVSATNIDEAATDTFYIVLHAVNLRPRMDPPLPNSAFGNLYRIAMTNPFMGACANLASQVRESISRIDKDYVKTQLQEGNEHLEMIKDTAESFNRGKDSCVKIFSLEMLVLFRLADASSFLTFLKSWAETARGESDIVRPQFISATLFPPKNISGFEPSTGITNQNIVAKRFVFNASAIETLRAKYTDHVNSTSVPPSRVGALTNFIWNRFVSAMNIDEAATDTFYIVLHAVNLRPRMDPPLPDSAFGNLYRIAMTNPFMGACTNLASQVRNSISRIDKEYVKSQLQEGNKHLEMIKDTAESFNRAYSRCHSRAREKRWTSWKLYGTLGGAVHNSAENRNAR